MTEITGIREAAAPRLQAVELAQAYRRRPVTALLGQLLAGRPDCERAGQAINVRVSQARPGTWRFDLHGNTTGQRLGALLVSDPDMDARLVAQALRVALHGADTARPEELDRVNELLGNPGWVCAHCAAAFVLHADCAAHEHAEHPTA